MIYRFKLSHRTLYFDFDTVWIKAKECSKLMDKNHERKKAFWFLKSTLPKNITFSGNLI